MRHRLEDPPVGLVTVITDCRDDNATARLTVKVTGYFRLATQQYVGLVTGPGSSLEAGLNVADVLNAGASGMPTPLKHVILVNAAPRATGEGHDNGVPFGSFRDPCGNLVVTTMNPDALAFMARFGLVTDVRVYELPTVMEFAAIRLQLTPNQVEDVINTQFRSLNFQPLLAWLIHCYGDEVPHHKLPVPAPASPTGRIARIDNFGNLFTDVFEEDVLESGRLPEKIEIIDGVEIPVFPRLADAPAGELVAVPSSSGYGTRRVLMVCTAGLDFMSGAERLGLVVGDPLIQLPQFRD